METEVKKIPYLDLKAINEPYEKEIKDAINKVVNSDPELQARVQSDPEISQILGGNDGNPNLQYPTN